MDPMATVTITQAEKQLAKLIDRAIAGEEVVITPGAKPVVRLAPVIRQKRKPGLLKGKVPDLPDEFFFDPLPDDELKRWGM
jgi:prevent-host-death family protein